MEDLQNNTSTPNRHVESVRAHKVRKSNGKNFVIFLLIILMLAGMFGSYYFYNKYSQFQGKVKSGIFFFGSRLRVVYNLEKTSPPPKKN